MGEAIKRGIAVRQEPITIASSHGLEAPLAMLPNRSDRRRRHAELEIYNTTAVLGRACRAAHKVVIVREWLEPGSIRHRMLSYRHAIGADAVVGVSSDVIGQWRDCVSRRTAEYVVHNWLDRSLLERTASMALDRDRHGILCIGRFNRWKGQDALASAYEQAFLGHHDRPTLTFVGSQPGSQFDQRAQQLRVRGTTLGWEVLPFASDPSVHFLSAELVVVPSLQPEPFGTVVLEAIAHGCRVIAFEGGGPTDMAKDFPGVVELASRREGRLASALTTWWDRGDRALSTTEIQRTRDTLESRYSPEAGADAWRAIIGKLPL